MVCKNITHFRRMLQDSERLSIGGEKNEDVSLLELYNF